MAAQTFIGTDGGLFSDEAAPFRERGCTAVALGDRSGRCTI